MEFSLACLTTREERERGRRKFLLLFFFLFPVDLRTWREREQVKLRGPIDFFLEGLIFMINGKELNLLAAQDGVVNCATSLYGVV